MTYGVFTKVCIESLIFLYINFINLVVDAEAKVIFVKVFCPHISPTYIFFEIFVKYLGGS